MDLDTFSVTQLIGLAAVQSRSAEVAADLGNNLQVLVVKQRKDLP